LQLPSTEEGTPPGEVYFVRPLQGSIPEELLLDPGSWELQLFIGKIRKMEKIENLYS